MKVVKFHRLPVSFVHVPVQSHDAVEVILLLRTQVTHADVLVGIVPHKVTVTLHLGVAPLHHVHAVLVGHGERGDVHHVLQICQHIVALFQQLRKAEGDCLTGWEILPGRGLDIFQKFVDGDWLNPLLRHQQLRRVKECKVTYRRIDEKQ